MPLAQLLERPTALPITEPSIRLRVGDQAPDAELRFGSRPTRLYRWIDDAWTMLFRLPDGDALEGAAELHRLTRAVPDFRARFVKLLGIAPSHAAPGEESLAFAVAADPHGEVAERYGLIGSAARNLVVIDPEHRLRLLLAYPRGRERDFADVLRLIMALQQADARERAGRSNWRSHQAATLGAW